MRSFSNKISRRILKIAKDNTPIQTGKMSKKWKIEKGKIGKGEVQIIIRNTSPYAHLIEDGHVQKDKNNKIVGFVQGNHMLKGAVREVEDELENYFNKEFFK